jgi:hypothetical protein
MQGIAQRLQLIAVKAVVAVRCNMHNSHSRCDGQQAHVIAAKGTIHLPRSLHDQFVLHLLVPFRHATGLNAVWFQTFRMSNPDGWKGCGEVSEEACHAAELVQMEGEQATYGKVTMKHAPKSRELDAQKIARYVHECHVGVTEVFDKLAALKARAASSKVIGI